MNAPDPAVREYRSKFLGLVVTSLTRTMIFSRFPKFFPNFVEFPSLILVLVLEKLSAALITLYPGVVDLGFPAFPQFRLLT